ncbi:aminopeptidase P family protein [Neisseria sp. Dent CA1/247]|uniref:aminopeptidase P family protein n=1 Tax=Neisseria sp. Dent CA1/247 TaxID=2912675 RepID=UPI001FD34E51|nr:aminopeptidase P family protein [Neisseria sp. Dent CA1/247]UOO77464.1 aminopeptidase P family protein [Neisseria sp. Dent CA1/247]
MNTPSQRLAALRDSMREHGFDAWIIPSADPHLSEYLPEHWQVRAYVSGFTGSVGTLVVKADSADLWADSRYWEQAEKQLAGSGIELKKLGFGKTHVEDLAETLPENAQVGVAADMLSLAAQRQLQTAFASKNIRLNHQSDLLGGLWAGRPALPSSEIYPHKAEFVSETAAQKLARVRAAVKEKGADYHLISSLDDIAWLTNLRGSDVSYNPVFLSYLLIGADTATLFVNQNGLSEESAQCLKAAGIGTADYHTTADALAAVSGKLLIDPAKTAVSTVQKLPDSVKPVESINPSTLFKSIKSDADIAHIREAMRQDGAALCGFFAELEQKLADGETVSELDIDTMLLAHRSRRPHFISHSFGTIAGYNANGALPHYSATPEAYSLIEGNGLLLIDSGGQYENGTTDITRVIPIGTPTAAQKRDFTLVLKAHIALAEAVFPENIAAPMIDAVCRAPMWKAQCDYGHGTGHGVGYFLNVHEGPQVISYHAAANPNHAMKAGMFTSNEPGLYRPGAWGIRIENLVINRPVAQAQETAFGKFLCFETVTLCPIDTRLMDVAMMSADEIEWVNNYHADVRAKLLPLVDGAAKAWLQERTQAV